MQVLDFIYEQQGMQRKIMEFLHELMLSHPTVVSKYRYKTAFYYQKNWICYLNKQKGDRVELNFIRALELSNENGLLDFRGRKMVAGIMLDDVASIPVEGIMEIMQEALVLDELVPYKFPGKSKKG